MAQESMTSIGPDQEAMAAQVQTCLLTTFNRTDGRSHDVEMRFALEGDRLFLLSDEGGDAHWVQNLLSNPEVSVRIGGITYAGMGRVIVNDAQLEQHCRQLLDNKYEGGRDEKYLSPWAQDALPILVELRP